MFAFHNLPFNDVFNKKYWKIPFYIMSAFFLGGGAQEEGAGGKEVQFYGNRVQCSHSSSTLGTILDNWGPFGPFWPFLAIFEQFLDNFARFLSILKILDKCLQF